jgi:hypothetical protein
MELIERIKIGAVTPSGRKTYRYAADMQDAQKKIQILRKRGHGSISTTEESFEPQGYILEGRLKDDMLKKQEDKTFKKAPPSGDKKKTSGFSKFNKVTSDLGYGPKKETKEAPDGHHFTRSGKLKKGDAGQDGDGGKMLRSDPLDKQRSKVPAVSEEGQMGVKQRHELIKKGIYPKDENKKPIKSHLFFHNYSKDKETGKSGLKPHAGLNKAADDHSAANPKKPEPKKVQETINKIMQAKLHELDTDTIKSAHTKRKKQEFDSSYKADSYGSDAQNSTSKAAEKNARGLQKQQRKVQDKASKGMSTANRALRRKGYHGASDYRLHDTNYDSRRKDEKSGKLKENNGGLTKSLAKEQLLKHLVASLDK